MLQWMGGARRKLNATRGSKYKRQQEFFETRKELNRRRAEDVEVPERVNNLGDCLQRITPLGESLDILGLRSLIATTENANAEPASNDELAEVPTARDKTGLSSKSDGVGVNASSSAPQVDIAIASEWQDDAPDAVKEHKTNDSHPNQVPATRAKAASTKRITQGGAAGGRKTQPPDKVDQLPLLEKKQPPIRVVNRQTKKVSPLEPARKKLLDMFSDDTKGGERRSPSKYAIFTIDGISGIDRNTPNHAIRNACNGISPDSVKDRRQTFTPLLQTRAEAGQVESSWDPRHELNLDTSDLLNTFLLSRRQLVNQAGIECENQKKRKSILPQRQQELKRTMKDSIFCARSLFGPSSSNDNQPPQVDFTDHEFIQPSRKVKQEPFSPDLEGDWEADPPAWTVEEKISVCKRNIAGRPQLGTEKWSISHNAWEVPDVVFNLKNELPGPTRVFLSGKQLKNDNLEDESCNKFSKINLEKTALSEDIAGGYFPSFETEEYSPTKFEDVELSPHLGVEKMHHKSAFSQVDDGDDYYNPGLLKTKPSTVVDDYSNWNANEDMAYRIGYQWTCDPLLSTSTTLFQDRDEIDNTGGLLQRCRDPDESYSWPPTEAEEKSDDFPEVGSRQGCRLKSPDFLSTEDNVTQELDPSTQTDGLSADEAIFDHLEPPVPSLVNCNKDFIIVCFPANEDSATSGDIIDHQYRKETVYPLQGLGNVGSLGGMEHDKTAFPTTTPFTGISIIHEVDDQHNKMTTGRVHCKRDTKGANASTCHLSFTNDYQEMQTNTKGTDELTCHLSFTNDYQETQTDTKRADESTCLLSFTNNHQETDVDTQGADESTCHLSFTNNRQETRIDYLQGLKPPASHKNDMDFMSWEVSDVQGHDFHGVPAETRSSSEKLLPKQSETYKAGLEQLNTDIGRAEKCSSSSVWCDQSEWQKGGYIGETHCAHTFTSIGRVQRNTFCISTTKEQLMPGNPPQEDNTFCNDDTASWSSQEECSPHPQSDSVQHVLYKLQRPLYSCSKQEEFLPNQMKSVQTVLIKLQRPTIFQNGENTYEASVGKRNLRQDLSKSFGILQDSDSKTDLQNQPTYGRRGMSVGQLNSIKSREFLALQSGDTQHLRRQTSVPLSLASNEDVDIDRLDKINVRRTTEVRLNLDDIETTAAATEDQPTQRLRQMENSDLGFKLLKEKEPPQVSVTPVRATIEITTVESNTALVSPRHSHNIQALTAGVHDNPPKNFQAAGKETAKRASQEYQAVSPTQVNLNTGLVNVPTGKNKEHYGHGKTDQVCDKAYVDMLESYVVQLKLENNLLKTPGYVLVQTDTGTY